MDYAKFAKKLGVKESRVKQWEQDGKLTFQQAENVAKASKIAPGLLFLSRPPTEDFGITDFRTVGNQPLKNPSPELAKTIYDIKARQNWLSRYRAEIGMPVINFVGSIEVNQNIHSASRKIVQELGIGRQISKGASRVGDTITAHIEKLEELGINIVKSGYCGTSTRDTFDVKEFRGFALSDPYAPFIFVNGADAGVAQLFTLVHEVVHIGLGVSGVDSSSLKHQPQNAIERFCNKVAAEILAPKRTVVAEWDANADPVRLVKVIAQGCKVSPFVIALKAFHEGLISWDDYGSIGDELKPVQPKTSGGGNYYNSAPYRLGISFGKAVFTSTAEGKTLFGDAMKLTGIKDAKTFKEVAKSMTGYEIFA